MTVLPPEVNANAASPQEEKKEVNLAQKQPEQIDQAAPNSENKEQINEDPNWKAFREARKRDRAEKEAAERRAADKDAEANALKAALEATLSKGNFQPQQQQYDGYSQAIETEEERIAKKVEEILARKEDQYRREAAQREAIEYPKRLMQTYSDFDKVVSQENLDYLDYHFPEIAKPLERMADGYEKYASVYQVIKKLVPNHGEARKDAAKAEANMQKPRSLSSPTLTQSGSGGAPSWQDTEARRAANWERMQKTLRGV